MSPAELAGLRTRHFPRKSTYDGSYHLATCFHGEWRNGKRPMRSLPRAEPRGSENCRADRATFDRLAAEALAEHPSPVQQLELMS
jgi:hypothetical protein